MPDYDLSPGIIRPMHPAHVGPRGEEIHEIGADLNVGIIRMCLVEGKTDTTEKQACYAIMRPCFPPAPVGFTVPKYDLSMGIVRMSLVEGKTDTTEKQTCYAIMQPCFAEAAAGLERQVHDLSMGIVRMSFSRPIRHIDLNPHDLSMGMIRPMVAPATPEFDATGEVGYYKTP